MGDVGALAIGGALAGLALMSRTELRRAVIAGLFVLETLSVLLQMTYFKLSRRITGTGRRIFRIAPIHHHFRAPRMGRGDRGHPVLDRRRFVRRAGLGIFYADWLS